MKRVVVGPPVLQLLLGSLTVAVIALYPPANGDVLIISLTGAAAAHIAAGALADTATGDFVGGASGSVSPKEGV